MINNLANINDLIVDKLTNIEEIKDLVKGIFTHVPANTKFPYIHLGKIDLRDKSTKTTNHYEVIINITIYIKDRNYKNLLFIIDKIKQNLTILTFLSYEIDQKPDGITSFANLKYKFHI